MSNVERSLNLYPNLLSKSKCLIEGNPTIRSYVLCKSIILAESCMLCSAKVISLIKVTLKEMREAFC